MSDLISREDAIKALCYCCGIECTEEEMQTCPEHYELTHMPSAELERKIELQGDESAIEILSELRSWFSCFDEKEGLAYHALSLAIRAIKANSIVQAEQSIIRCKDCKHIQKWRSEESAKKFGQIYECARSVLACPKPDDFCSYAESRGDSK